MEAGRGALQKRKNATRTRHGLDALNFFVADVQTGFGPFVAVYLTAHKWTQIDIGLVFTAGALVGLFFQVPGGALIDAVKSIRLVAALAITAIALSAAAVAAWPSFPVVLASRLVQASASCVLGPAIVAMSLGVVRRADAPRRLGRNASFASAGTALAAGGMGICGYFWSTTAVFYLSAALAVPALIAITRIDDREIDTKRAHGADVDETTTVGTAGAPRAIWGNWPLMIFALCIVLFQMTNAGILPLVGSIVTLRANHSATILIAVALVVPQLIVTVLSPTVGRTAQRWGRRPLLLIAFAALPIRAVLSAFVTDPQVLVGVQLLDGVSAAVLGVLIPLVIADVTRATGRFNLAQGVVGCAVGLGAAASTTLIGYVADHYGSSNAFLAIAVLGSIGLMVVLLACPETSNLVRPSGPMHRGITRS